MPKYWWFPTVFESKLTIQAGFWPYKRGNVTLKCSFCSGLAKNWPYKRVDFTSVDHTSGRDCTCKPRTSWAWSSLCSTCSKMVCLQRCSSSFSCPWSTHRHRSELWWPSHCARPPCSTRVCGCLLLWCRTCIYNFCSLIFLSKSWNLNFKSLIYAKSVS